VPDSKRVFGGKGSNRSSGLNPLTTPASIYEKRYLTRVGNWVELHVLFVTWSNSRGQIHAVVNLTFYLVK